MAGATVVVAALVVNVRASHREWFARAHPVMRIYPLNHYPATQAVAMAEATTAARYVARDGGGRPVVYLVQSIGEGGSALAVTVAAAGIIRDALPPDQILRSAFYVGD